MEIVLYTIIIVVLTALVAFAAGMSYGTFKAERESKKPVMRKRTRKTAKAETVSAALAAPSIVEPDYSQIDAAVNQIIVDTAKSAYVAAKRGWMIKPREEGGINVFTRMETEQILMGWINAEEGTVVVGPFNEIWTKAMTPGNSAPALPQGEYDSPSYN